MTDDKLTALFDSARNAPLETSTADVNKWIASTAVGVGIAASLKVFFIKQWVIMTSILASLTGAGVIAVFTLNSPAKMKQQQKEKTQFSLSQKVLEQPEKERNQPFIFPVKTEEEKEENLYLKPLQAHIPLNVSQIPVRLVTPAFPQNIDNKSFTRIEASGFTCFTLVQGSACSVTTTLDSSEVLIDIEDGKLEITGMQENDPSAIIITVVELKDLELSGFSKMVMTGTLITKEVEIEVDGFSKCQFNGDVSHLEAEISGQSSFDLTGKCTKLDMEISGMSNSELSINCIDIELEITGQSSLEMNGTVTNLEAEVSGDSELKAKECVAEKINIDVSGASEATVQVTLALDADVSGKSKLNYYGTPQELKENASGLSTIKAKK
jgi:hypothetical protein